jgi:glycerol-3-phosphate dehydrogenase (NAD(P)+)
MYDAEMTVKHQKIKISILGAGTWGFCLAALLASKGHTTISWMRDAQLAKQLTDTREHPFLKGHHANGNMSFTTNLHEALTDINLLVESVTSAGLRPVFEQVKSICTPHYPIVITSKGIEQNTGLILPNVMAEALGEQSRSLITCLSGPSYAEEVIKGLPTSVVVSAYDKHLMKEIAEIFTTKTFRVYPNSDIHGVSYGGALKNIIAIACGIADGLGMGFSAKAALMTRGLHEIRKLAVAKGCQADTLNGLSGMGDLCVTCSSLISRNCRFGYLMAQGLNPKEAQKKIGMVVEGAYTCLSALQLSKQLGIPMPITETVYKIVYENMAPSQAVQKLMARTIKEEHL